MNQEIYHYGVKGMKWGVRRAARKAKRNATRYKKEATYYTQTRDDIKKGNFEKYGYKSFDQAKQDRKNWNRIINDNKKIAKKWMSIHDELCTKSVDDVKKAKQLISDGKEYTNRVLAYDDFYIEWYAIRD